MFDAESQKRADVLLANYGATHFLLTREGEIHAVQGTQIFLIEGGQHVQLLPSDAELASEAIAAAAKPSAEV